MNENLVPSLPNTSSNHPSSYSTNNDYVSQEKQCSLNLAISSLKDKTGVLLDNRISFTVEATDFSRKYGLLEQLKIARRLRASMERAANIAETSAPNESVAVMLDRKRDINELVALTQAFHGNYFLDSYHVYNDMYEAKERIREKEMQAATKVIGTHVRDLSNERNHSSVTVNNEKIDLDCREMVSLRKGFFFTPTETPKPQFHQTSAESNKEESTGVKDNCGPIDMNDKISDSEEEFLRSLYIKKIYTDKNKAISKMSKLQTMALNNSQKETAKVSSSIKKHTLVPDRLKTTMKKSTIQMEYSKKKSLSRATEKKPRKSLPSDFSSSSSSVMCTSKTYKGKHSQVNDDLYAELDHSNRKQGGVKEHVSYSIKPPKKKNLPFRKCHNCKVSNNEYLRCNFFFANGNKCGKIYCKECMIGTYSLADFEASSRDHEWHCPSCTGICKCTVCVKERERTKKRASTSERRSARGSSYIF